MMDATWLRKNDSITPFYSPPTHNNILLLLVSRSIKLKKSLSHTLLRRSGLSQPFPVRSPDTFLSVAPRALVDHVLYTLFVYTS
jgi:hypothetical protein